MVPPTSASETFRPAAFVVAALLLGLTVAWGRGPNPPDATSNPCPPTESRSSDPDCSPHGEAGSVHISESRIIGERMFGAFTYYGVWGGMEPVLELEADLGRRLDVVHWFMNWQHEYDSDLVAAAGRNGRRPLISWQPHQVPVAAIADGLYDDYMRSWARGVAMHPRDVYLRPFPEMNGDWVPWNGDPATFISAWRRMVAIFREEGASNARWVWSPNLTDWPRTEANAMERYYPGDDVVDILSMSGYNWGEVRDWSTWRSFEEIFRAPYDRITAIGPQPVWLTELASAERGGDKSAWIRNMLGSTAFPRIEAVVWFDEHKDADWRIRSSPETLAAFREYLGRTEVASTSGGAESTSTP